MSCDRCNRDLLPYVYGKYCPGCESTLLKFEDKVEELKGKIRKLNRCPDCLKRIKRPDTTFGGYGVARCECEGSDDS